jgi:hypothetical protein
MGGGKIVHGESEDKKVASSVDLSIIWFTVELHDAITNQSSS